MSSILSKEQQDIRKANGMALLEAVRGNKLDEAVRLLTQENTDLDVTDEDGYTPIYDACSYNRPELAKLLLEYGANVNVAMKDGRAPIERACDKSNFAMVKLLLEYGANVNVTLEAGYTPIDRVCYYNDLVLVKLLLEYGANVNVTVYGGYNPIDWPCFHNKPVLAKVLLIAGAEVKHEYAEKLKEVIYSADHDLQFSEQFEVIQKDDGSIRYLFKNRVQTTYDQIIQKKLDKNGVIATDVAALFKQPEKVISLSGALHKAGFAQMLTQGDSKCLHKAVRTKENHAESNITCRNIEKAARRDFSKELDKASEKWADKTGDSFGIPMRLF